MIHGSLFSGVGGWSVASDLMGWTTAFMCEWDENKQYVLKHHWPNAEIYGDITTTDFSIWRGRIDILSASTPCQPFSNAGKRQGANDVRHLWPATLRTLREVQPQFFVLENVPGLVNWSKGMVFKQIITDLEDEGYQVLPFLLPACGVNAPHKRERIWIVAKNTNRNGRTGKQRQGKSDIRGLRDVSAGDNERLCANDAKIRATSDTTEQGQQEWQQNNGWTDSKENRTRMDDRPERSGSFGDVANSDQAGYKGNKFIGTFKQGFGSCEPHESATQLHQTDNWLNFPTISPIRYGDDGFSRDSLRLFINENSGGLLTEKEVDQIIQKSLNKWNNETITAGGDAVVPAVVYQIFKAIEQYTTYLTGK